MTRSALALICLAMFPVATACAGETTRYAVLDSSTYYFGCIDPCRCVWADTGTLQGEFDLTLRETDEWYAYYDVTNVRLLVSSTIGQREATGSGEYIVGGDFAYTELLRLTLLLDGETRQFESMVELDPAFPAIETDVGMNNFECFDTILGLRAAPVVTGDANCDGAVNNFDIDPFVLALTDTAAYREAFPNCPSANADANSDGAVNNFDIDAFVDLLIG